MLGLLVHILYGRVEVGRNGRRGGSLACHRFSATHTSIRTLLVRAVEEVERMSTSRR